MKTIKTLFLSLLLLCAGASTAAAQNGQVYSQHGEISIGAQAPTRDEMVSTIRTGAPSAIFSTLEYGERVECTECVPLLQQALLSSTDPSVREISAWWLRRHPYGFGAVMHQMKAVLSTSPDATQRSRAAEAIGEFMDVHGLDALRTAVMSDSAPAVRASAVRAIGRINVDSGNDTIAAALADHDTTVRQAALSVVLSVNFFRQYDALIPLLADTDASVRRRTAQLVGEFHVDAAVPALAGILRGDTDSNVRQAAAWALGRIGGADAIQALSDAASHETASGVRDAIEIAQQMHP